MFANKTVLLQYKTYVSGIANKTPIEENNSYS